MSLKHLVNGSSLSSRFWQTKTEAKGENPIKVPYHQGLLPLYGMAMQRMILCDISKLAGLKQEALHALIAPSDLYEVHFCTLPDGEEPECNLLPVIRHKCLRLACPMHAL